MGVNIQEPVMSEQNAISSPDTVEGPPHISVMANAIKRFSVSKQDTPHAASLGHSAANRTLSGAGGMRGRDVFLGS